MKNVTFILTLAATVFLSSCGKHITVAYSTETSVNSGTLHIQPSRSIGGTFLTVNQKILVENENVKKITVNGLPDGTVSWHLVCNNSGLKDKVNEQGKAYMKKGTERTELVEVPPMSDGFWINSGLTTLATWTGLVILYFALD
jgi:hypothetical protein